MRKRDEYLPKLLEYIDLVNKIPKDIFFPNRSSVAESTSERLGEKPYSYADLIETCQNELKDLPPEIYNFVFPKQIENSSEVYSFIQEKLDLLSSLYFGIFFLGYMISELHFYSDKTSLELNEYLVGFSEQVPGNIAELKVEIIVNKDGFIQLKINAFLDFISKHKIEANRIRYCFVCSKIFWANRKDKWNCSATCGNIQRQRNWQSENKDEYNEKRRSNYAYKQMIKQQKEKKNGNL